MAMQMLVLLPALVSGNGICRGRRAFSERHECAPRWFHCPKCGTSFGTLLLRLGHPERFGSYICDDKRTGPSGCTNPANLLFDVEDACFGDRLGDMSDSCLGAPPGMWPPERAFGLHLPIPKGLVSAGQSRFYGIFREPKSRALSSYTYFRRLFNETMPDVGGETPTPAGAAWYAQRIRGVVARQLAGETKGIICTAPDNRGPCPKALRAPNPQRVNEARFRLNGFRFVGLQSEWLLSICLLRTMTDTKCEVSDTANARPGARGIISASESRRLHRLRSAIYAVNDTDDEAVYAMARQRFWADVALYNLSRSGCERKCRPPPTAGLVVRGFGDMGIDREGYPTHYSHLLRNWLPRLWECQGDFPQERALFVPKKLVPLYADIVARYGMTITQEKGVECAFHIPARPPSYFFDMFADPARNLRAEQGCSSSDVVLVLRTSKRAERRRSIANPGTVAEVVGTFARQKNLSFEVVSFEDYAFAEQLRKVCTTRLLIGQHGAGIGNALWSYRRPMVVLELPPTLPGWWSGLLAPRYGFTYYHDVSEGHCWHDSANKSHSVTRGTRVGSNTTMTVSVPHLRTLLHKGWLMMQKNNRTARKQGKLWEGVQPGNTIRPGTTRSWHKNKGGGRSGNANRPF